MRALLILVCTINLFIVGCKTGTKQSTCAVTSCGCTATHIGCTATHIGVTAAELEQPEELAQTAEVQIEQVKSSVTETINPFENAEVLAKPEPRAEISIPEYGHEKNYRWLLGHLQRVHSTNHRWKIRYAPLDQNDEWGGSVILAPDARLDEWNDGDMVYVEGEILNERPSVYLTGPLYRVHLIRAAKDGVYTTSRALP